MPRGRGCLGTVSAGEPGSGCSADDGTMVRSTLACVVLLAAGACTPSTHSESMSNCAADASIVVDPMEYSLDAEELVQFDPLALAVLTFDSVEAANNRFSALSNRIGMSSSRWTSFAVCPIRRNFWWRSSPTSNETGRFAGSPIRPTRATGCWRLSRWRSSQRPDPVVRVPSRSMILVDVNGLLIVRGDQTTPTFSAPAAIADALLSSAQSRRRSAA